MTSLTTKVSDDKKTVAVKWLPQTAKHEISLEDSKLYIHVREKISKTKMENNAKINIVENGKTHDILCLKKDDKFFLSVGSKVIKAEHGKETKNLLITKEGDDWFITHFAWLKFRVKAENEGMNLYSFEAKGSKFCFEWFF